MAVLETQPITDEPLERAVFVTDDDRRARRLRRGAFVATALACLWVVGLGVGMFGFGGIPGVGLVKRGGHDGNRSSDPSAVNGALVSDARPAGSARSSGVASLAAERRAASLARARNARARAARGTARQAPAVPVAAPPPAAQPPANPAGRQRGWARKGLPPPRGQVRKTLPPPPPPPNRGQRRGQTTTTTTTTPLPPGQAKKIPPPPPEG